MYKNILTKLLHAENNVENETFTYENEKYIGDKFTIIILLEENPPIDSNLNSKILIK